MVIQDKASRYQTDELHLLYPTNPWTATRKTSAGIRVLFRDVRGWELLSDPLQQIWMGWQYRGTSSFLRGEGRENTLLPADVPNAIMQEVGDRHAHSILITAKLQLMKNN